MNNRILIVDDNQEIHNDFYKILCPATTTEDLDRAEEALFGTAVSTAPTTSYVLTSAYQGLEAINLVREAKNDKNPYALAFVDVRMPPGLDGVETIKELWAIDPNLEIVISTAYSDYSWDQIRAKLQQADWLLMLKKPFDNIEVLQLTKALTRKWQLERNTQTQIADLRRANAILEAQRETSIDGILVVDESHKVLAYNGRFVQLWTVPQAVLSTNDDNLLMTAIATKLSDPLSFYDRLRQLDAEPNKASRDEVILADGRIFDRYCAPILGEDGQNFGRVWYFRDVTQERETQNSLRLAKEAADNANTAKSMFLANMSHEIRTPMTAILGYADLLADEKKRTSQLTPVQREEYIRTIKRNGQHLLTIINDILDISKIEGGKMTVEHIETNPVQLIHDVLSLMQVNARAKSLELSAVCETHVPVLILSDPLRLRQILLNLVSNAIKFTQTGKVTIRISVDQSNPADPILNFRVTDTGIGMNPEQTSRLFGAFEQADVSTTRQFGGTGLGLRISKRLAQMLNGDIDVQSKPGQGSTFTLFMHTGSLAGVQMLPPDQALQVVRDTARPVSTIPGVQSLSGVRILLAEDGPDNQKLITFHLNNAGADVRVFENGELLIKALTTNGNLEDPIVQNSRIDLVLMDMQMPVMDGYSATRLLRSKGCKIPIVALTAHAMAGDADECFNAGCDDYAVKPIDGPRLISTCAKWAKKTSSAQSSSVPAGIAPTAPSPQSTLKSEFSKDARMAKLVQEYTRTLAARIVMVQKHMAENQLEEISFIAHQLAGSAGSYGFPTITEAARDVETHIRNHADAAILNTSLEKLIALCKRASA